LERLVGRWGISVIARGPWRWMLIVYEYFEDEKTVVIVTIQDGRSWRAATTTR
jgi:hypothetical protein